MGRVLRITGIVLLLAVAGIAVLLGYSHWQVRSVRPNVPVLDAINSTIAQKGGPVRLAVANTASQEMPRSAVLESSIDPRPQIPYTMAFPSFALEWSDGRTLLVDTGMTVDEARGFGRNLELVGAKPIVAHGPVAQLLGERCSQVSAVVFTHLHSDHVGGLPGICACAGHEVTVFMTPTQEAVINHTTRGGRRVIADAPCARIEILPEGPVVAVPGFPGVAVAHAGGHTPGSQAVFAAVGDTVGIRQYAFTGDLANHLDGILSEIPKPKLYSLLVVPEDGTQLAGWRALFRSLHTKGYGVVVSHDQRAIEALNLPPIQAR